MVITEHREDSEDRGPRIKIANWGRYILATPHEEAKLLDLLSDRATNGFRLTQNGPVYLTDSEKEKD